MLASITPLGERGRQSTWAVTVTAFALAATAAGALAGALLGEVGALAIPAGAGADARLAALVGALIGALALDGLPRAVPGPRRQVNPLWLDEFRGWVYGLGYGAQLGLAVTTVVTSAATYAALLAALLTGSPAKGAVIMGGYGAVRGLTPLATAHVRSAHQLIAALARLERRRADAAVAGRVALGLAALAGLTGWLA